MIPHRVLNNSNASGNKKWFRSVVLILLLMNLMCFFIRKRQLRYENENNESSRKRSGGGGGFRDFPAGGEQRRDKRYDAVATLRAVEREPRFVSSPFSSPPPPKSPPFPPPPPSPLKISPECDAHSSTIQPRTEYAGDVVHWGDTNDQPSVEACCMQCTMTKMCNVFVYNPQTKKCWLKKQKELYENVEPGTMAKGDNVVWTSGTIGPYRKRAEVGKDGVRKMQDIVESEKTKVVDAKRIEPSLPIGQETRKRECGSPAVDGYAHVKPPCLVNSITNKEFDRTETSRLEQIAWIEKHASYDGLAVRWGIGHKAATAEECAQKCREHVPGRGGGPFNDLPCNAFAWCDIANDICFEPDAHVHTAGDCWLKFTEVPERVEVNQRGANDDPFDGFLNDNKLSYKMRHVKAPAKAHWTSGVLLPRGWIPSNGTLGPRAKW
jgi:preprotein translocase subunit YajC